jgi:radical SAM protein with 4Fe4S-binding SPASM domain
MKEQTYDKFTGKLKNAIKKRQPINGQIELTYRCNLNCVHCYCKGSEEKSSIPKERLSEQARLMPHTENRELTTLEWKKILDEIHREGCLWLCFTGGDPLIRDDFLELYSYAKNKGFIITLFTNGLLLTGKIMDYLEKSPPESIEITLNGITEAVYESITHVKGSFERVISVIKELADRNLPLILKSNCLKQNKDEIGRIKAFTDKLLGKGNKRWRFKYDPMIYARLNGNTTPCDYRLSSEELLEVNKQDPEIWEQYEKSLCGKFPDMERDKDFLYLCNAWMGQFFINPYGRLKFCAFSDKFSVDLRNQPFREGFYNVFPQLLKERFKTDSKCRNCSLRTVCYYCPARAFLETGNEEAPVPYYCELAKATAEEMGVKQ